MASPAAAGELPAHVREVVKQIIGHRGSAADRPENTLVGIRRAIEAGATAVEFDIRRTKDGHFVLMHDAAVDRTTNGRGVIANLTLDDIRKLDAGSWFGDARKFAGERVPTLAEALGECRGRIDALLDLKEQGEAYDRAVIDQVKQFGDPRRTIVGVRSVEQAKRFRRGLPEARQLGLIAEPDDLDAYVSVGVESIRLWPKWLDDPTLVQRVRWAGAKLHLGATVGTPEEVLPLVRHRPDSLSADDPARLIETLTKLPPAIFVESDASRRTPVILDTDIGSDIDDAFALGLALASSELDIKAITTVGGQADDRAWMVCRFLTQTGRRTIPVAAGTSGPRVDGIDWQIQYRRHPAVVWNRTVKPVREDAVELLYRQLEANRGTLTIIAIGPLTNIGRLLESHPDCEPWIKRIVIMGGSIRVGYKPGSPPEPEWNIAGDVAAARRVFRSSAPLTVIPLDATAAVNLERPERERIFGARTPLTFQLQALYELWDRPTPVLFDPVAVAAVLSDDFCTWDEMRLDVDERGMTRVVADSNSRLRPVRVATAASNERFLKWFVERLANTGRPIDPRPAANPATLVPRGGFPARVHVVEDYDTDIEKRWWMAGKPELKDVPPAGRRAQRAVPTQDFDDLQGDTRATYRAVIFNPVPGPPMGPNTRLSFRYKLTGSDRMRVQLYSLSNGYHRYLSLSGLAQGEWREAAVDLTQMRRPDGTGGPLAADERIDDVQFYVDPQTELLIDDIVLYDAADSDERRPFPKRFVFSGWFDTGKQGQEWPGDFEIVPHEAPMKWKHAKSVLNAETNAPWIRVSLRGARRLDAVTELTFRHRLNRGGLRVELRHTASGASFVQETPASNRQEWTTTTLRFATPPKSAGEDVLVDEIRFVPSTASDLRLDDVLLYTPD